MPRKQPVDVPPAPQNRSATLKRRLTRAWPLARRVSDGTRHRYALLRVRPRDRCQRGGTLAPDRDGTEDGGDPTKGLQIRVRGCFEAFVVLRVSHGLEQCLCANGTPVLS